jgi:hypothetical protein
MEKPLHTSCPPLPLQKRKIRNHLVDDSPVARERAVDAGDRDPAARHIDGGRVAAQELRHAAGDHPAVILIGGLGAVAQRRLAHPLALEEAGAGDDVAADQPVLEIERIVMDVEQQDAGKEMRDVGGLDIASRRKAPRAAPRQPIAVERENACVAGDRGIVADQRAVRVDEDRRGRRP